jgi:hypothetical protein
MNKKLKCEIMKAFEAPTPNAERKARFINSLPRRKISMREFVFTQVGFIRKSAWVISALLLFPAVLGAYLSNENTIWAISAFIPFLAMVAITESMKSSIYGMKELEMAARFSPTNVVLARLLVLGIFDVLILVCLIPICYASNTLHLVQVAVYLFVPYLLTATISLWISRRFRHKEVLYGCMSIATMISVLYVLLHLFATFIFTISTIHWWLIFMLLLLVTMTREIYLTVKQTEVMAWN